MPRAQRPKLIPRGTPEEEGAAARVGGLSLTERYLLEHRLVFLTGNIDQAIFPLAPSVRRRRELLSMNLNRGPCIVIDNRPLRVL